MGRERERKERELRQCYNVVSSLSHKIVSLHSTVKFNLY